jgi:phage baseplate assembly protein W
MASADIPQFSFPFRLQNDGTAPVVVEQDSDDDIVDCVEVLLRTERGSREELPDYGIPDQAFKMGGADYEVLEEAISRWEPRAHAAVEHVELVDLVERVRVNVRSTGA